MHNIYILLFYEFFKTGLFTFGGGYASLPFLYNMCEVYHWFSYDELMQLIAISGITPGPIGLNMATYAGFKTLGLIGAVIASVSLILPMFIIATRIFKLYTRFSENNYVKSILFFLRPTSCALIASVGIRLFYKLALNNQFRIQNINYEAVFIVFILFILTFKMKRTPIIYILAGGLLGIVFKNIL